MQPGNRLEVVSKPLKANTVGILQPGYLPWIGFFEQIDRCDAFVLYDDVQFGKGSWRNRNRIKTPCGIQWLTVPVLLKGRKSPSINEVEINTSVRWADKHIKTLTQNYSRAPFFSKYADDLFEILQRSWRLLNELDLALIHWLLVKLGIKTPIYLSSEMAVAGKNVQRLIDIIQTFGGTHFYEGASGRNYIDVIAFERAGIQVIFQDYNHPTYFQQHGDFVSHLSIIDLLFNCGKDSLSIIRKKQ